MISIIDLDIGNVGSISNMLKKLNQKVQLIQTSQEVLSAEKLILPGVGAFDYGMQRITDLGLANAIMQKAKDGVPLLGICLGMQLLLQGSEEGNLPGLGLIDGIAKKFDRNKLSRKVPHMGWNSIIDKSKSSFLSGITEDSDSRFYFVHSYYADQVPTENTLCLTNYGMDFVSGIMQEKVFGVQFHPEKSHRFGMQLMRNFSYL